MNHVATTALLVSLVSCATACGLSNRSQLADAADAAVVAHSSRTAALPSRRAPLVDKRRGSTARLDAERLRAANAMAVLHVGLAGLSLPSRD